MDSTRCFVSSMAASVTLPPLSPPPHVPSAPAPPPRLPSPPLRNPEIRLLTSFPRISRKFSTLYCRRPPLCNNGCADGRRGWNRSCGPRAAYLSDPAHDLGADEDGKVSSSSVERLPPVKAVSWGIIWSLLLRNKARIAVAVIALLGCTTCTLSMPIFSGSFFEILVGRRSESLPEILSKIGLVYVLEPIFTITFVLNMTILWEKVMASLRSQVFKRLLSQRVEFFDRYKVGELTGLLTSDLGALKDVVTDNVSRDRGLRALSEASSCTLLNESFI